MILTGVIYTIISPFCRVISLAIIAISCSQTAFSQSNAQKLIEKYCDAKHRYEGFNGNILVAKKGKIFFQKSYGYADFNTRKPLGSNSSFNICSISKELTATAIILCKRKNLISLEDTLRKFFPELPYSSVTIKQMLTHSSGIVSSEFLFSHWNKETAISEEEMLQLLIQEKPPLLFNPGEKFEYSNIAYVLLAMIVEKVSNQKFSGFLKANIFDKLKMSRSGVGTPANFIKNQTANYIFDYLNDSATRKTYFEPRERKDWEKAFLISGLYGNSNIFSTTNDLLKWQQGIAGGKIISPRLYHEMTSPKIEANFAGINYYGYGFSINAVYDDTMVFHNGGTLGYSTTLRYLKNKGFTIITLCNTNRTNDPVEGIMAILYGQKIISPTADIPLRLSRQELDFFSGTYETGGRQFKIERHQDTLFRMVDGAQPLRLIPKKGKRLYYTDGSDREILFENEAGKLKVYLLKADGLALELKKL